MKRLIRFPTFIVFVFLLISCGGSGGDGDGNCIPSVVGDPDMTGAPVFDLTTVTAGTSVNVTLPVDGEVGYVFVSLIKDSVNFEFHGAAPVILTPGVQDVQVNFDTTGFTSGNYYPLVGLCTEQQACSNGSEVQYTTFLPLGTNYERNRTMNNGQAVDEFISTCIQIPILTIN